MGIISKQNQYKKINTMSLNTLMVSHLNDNNEINDGDSLLKAEKILHLMRELKIKGFNDMKPNTKSYNTIIEGCIRKNNNIDRAEDILKQVEKVVINDNEKDISLENIHIMSIMRGYINMSRIDKADNILKRFEKYVYDGKLSNIIFGQSFYHTIVQAYKKLG